jgi:hypothetical protein
MEFTKIPTPDFFIYIFKKNVGIFENFNRI